MLRMCMILVYGQFMKSRFQLLHSLLSPEQMQQLERVRGALDKDPTCLDRADGKNEKRIQGISAVTPSSSKSTSGCNQ